MATVDSNDNARQDIYHKLLDVIPDLASISEGGKSIVDGYMDLNLDVLFRSPEKLIIALSHYYRHPSGDMIPDPDMEVAVFLAQERAEALSYQDSFGYQSVMQDEGNHASRLQRDMNIFLSVWLGNLIQQGHSISTRAPAAKGSDEYVIASGCRL